MIEVLDLFSAAAGGWSLGMHRAGFTTIAACEVEPWRRALYSENNPNVKVYDDVRTLTANRLRADFGRLPSVIVGSPPCQDISSANTKGKGVEGERSGLYFEAVRIIGEVRPRWFALENSSNLRTRGADAVSAALEAIGYASWPCVVRAGDSANSKSAGIGANHERPRCWLIGCDIEQTGNASGWAIGAKPDVHSGAGANDARGGSTADTAVSGYAGRGAVRSGWETGHQYEGDNDAPGIGVVGGEDASDTNQARQADGSLEPCLRQTKVADDGRGSRRSNDQSSARQMGICPPDSGAVSECGSNWTLADLADHLRLDDGLSAGLAGARVALGNGKGQSAASLIVEAFGDAVVPQIPEAIGRAILRTERALATIFEGSR